jgi:hypothetical protein
MDWKMETHSWSIRSPDLTHLDCFSGEGGIVKDIDYREGAKCE